MAACLSVPPQGVVTGRTVLASTIPARAHVTKVLPSGSNQDTGAVRGNSSSKASLSLVHESAADLRPFFRLTVESFGFFRAAVAAVIRRIDAFRLRPRCHLVAFRHSQRVNIREKGFGLCQQVPEGLIEKRIVKD
jgi:hypothetical protein